MAPPVLDSVVDEQGRPVHRGTAQPVKKDMLVGSSTLSPAETVPLQEVVQHATQTYHAVPSLNALAAQASAQLQRLKESMASRIWQTTAAQVQTTLLTECTRVQAWVASKAGETTWYQKMLSSITQENTQLQQLQKALSMPPLWEEENQPLLQMAASFRTMEQEAHTLLNSAPPAWLAAMQTATAHAREDHERLRRVFTSVQPLIDSRWKEAQERLQTLVAPLKVSNERVRAALQSFQPEGLRAQQKLQELVASFQVSVQDLKTRLQPFLDWMASEAYQKQMQRMSDINTMVGACCPLYRESDLEYQQEDRINAALTRLIAQLYPGLRNPRAAQALRQQAQTQHTSPQDFLRTVVFPAAIRLVASEVTSPQRMRVGRAWVTNTHGKVLVASPWGAPLTVQAFHHWFFSQVYAAAAAIVLDEVYPRPTTQQARVVVYEEVALERLTAPASAGACDSAMLATLLQAEEPAPADQLHRVLTVASPRARELFRLLSQGLSIKEAAAVLGMSPSTAYVHRYRTRAKGRRC